MKKTYVYVLLIESVTRGERDDSIIEVFNNIENAQARLEEMYNKNLKEWQEWCDPDFLEYQIHDSKLYAEINEKYNMSYNHVLFSIGQKEVK